MKAGVKTSEFWLTLAVIIAASVLLGLERIDQGAWTVAVGIGSTGYVASRTTTKLYE